MLCSFLLRSLVSYSTPSHSVLLNLIYYILCTAFCSNLFYSVTFCCISCFIVFCCVLFDDICCILFCFIPLCLFASHVLFCSFLFYCIPFHCILFRSVRFKSLTFYCVPLFSVLFLFNSVLLSLLFSSFTLSAATQLFVSV